MEMGGIVMDGVRRRRKSEGGGEDLRKETKEREKDGIEGD